MNRQETELDLTIDPNTLSMHYGQGTCGPEPEYRTLDAIRPSLMDPQCSGPSPIYSIAMDVRREKDLTDLQSRFLLFGVVGYAAGQLGEEPVRSQGHVHAVAPHSGWSPPELFEIWEGTAIIYAQESTSDDPGPCFAISAGPGDKVVVPPGWAHAVINASTEKIMVFGAWCDRQYGFEYTGVRAHGGLAYFPIVGNSGAIHWRANPRYRASSLLERGSRSYRELGLEPDLSLYANYLAKPSSVDWVADPERFARLWPTFVP